MNSLEEISDPVIYEGYLKKWTNPCSRWQERYFVLRKNILYYYLTKGMRYKGKIHLQVATINLDEKSKTKFAIDGGIQILYLIASSENERNQWKDILRKAVRLQQLIQPKPITKNLLNHTESEKVQDTQMMKKFLSTKELLDDLSSSYQQIRNYNPNRKHEYEFHTLQDRFQVK